MPSHLTSWVLGFGKDYADDCYKAEERRGRVPHWWQVELWQPGYLRIFAKYAPLIAAIFAPLATLLDIPALSERWYTLNDEPQPDPTACLVLSAVGLTLNVGANILLIMRFSSHTQVWVRHTTVWSLVCWLGKTAVAAVNLILFGLLTRNTEGYAYTEGFWCAVVSMIDSGIISIALLLHFFMAFRSAEDSVEVRIEGRKFMLSVQLFLIILGLQACAFFKLEGWQYSDAIYFSVQTALTIGYGDLVPTTTAGKILIFPFSVLTISQLGNEIALIIAFISGRAEARRNKWRRHYEGMMHREAKRLRPTATLIEEMALIQEINQREEWFSQLYDLLWSAVSLVVFWVIGAAMFSCIEGWSFGNGVYAVMIMSLTIGFGDYTPEQPAGRVVFIVYALMAVPIVTSFAVQSITGLLSTYSARSSAKDAFIRDRRNHPDAFKPHSEYVLRAHESYAQMRQRLLGEPSCIPEEELAGEDDSSGRDNVTDDRGQQRDPHGDVGDDEQVLDGGQVTFEPDQMEDQLSRRAPSLHDASLPEAGPSGQIRPGRFGHAGSLFHSKRASGSKSGTGKKKRQNSLANLVDEWNEAAKKDWNREELTEEEEKVRRQYGRVTKILEARKARQRKARIRPGHRRNDASSASSGRKGSTSRYGSTPGVALEPLVENQDRDGHVSGVNDALDEGDTIDFDEKQESDDEQEAREVEIELVKHLMQLIVKLEAEARQMLLDSMDKTVARTLLLADRNGWSRGATKSHTPELTPVVQVRDVRATMGDEVPILAVWHGEIERVHPGSTMTTTSHDRGSGKVRSRGSEDTAAGSGGSGNHTHEKAFSSSHVENDKGSQVRHRDVYALQPLPQDEAPSMLARVRAYRNTFAEILVIGSILQKLEGEELRAFERFRLEEAQRDLAKHKQEEEALAATGTASSSGLRLPSRRATVTAPPAAESQRRVRQREESTGEDLARAQEDVEALEDVADERWDGITSRLVKKEGRRLKHLLTGGNGGNKTFRRAKTMA